MKETTWVLSHDWNPSDHTGFIVQLHQLHNETSLRAAWKKLHTEEFHADDYDPARVEVESSIWQDGKEEMPFRKAVLSGRYADGELFCLILEEVIEFDVPFLMEEHRIEHTFNPEGKATRHEPK